jgi:hypothetical protein
MYNQSYHLYRACQDCLFHKRQEREVIIQGTHPALPCTPTDVVPTLRANNTSTQEKEQQKPEMKQAQPSARRNYQDDQCSQRKSDHLLAPPFLVKKDDPGVPTIKCTINQKIFRNTFCDIGSGANIISKVTYEYLFGNEPLYPIYMQLQMADESLRWPKGVAKDVLVKIQDYYVPANFLVLDMPGDEDTPIFLGRPFLNTTDIVLYIGSGQIHYGLPKACYQFNSYTNYEQPKKSRSRRRHQSRDRSFKDG